MRGRLQVLFTIRNTNGMLPAGIELDRAGSSISRPLPAVEHKCVVDPDANAIIGGCLDGVPFTSGCLQKPGPRGFEVVLSYRPTGGVPHPIEVYGRVHTFEIYFAFFTCPGPRLRSVNSLPVHLQPTSKLKEPFLLQ